MYVQKWGGGGGGEPGGELESKGRKRAMGSQIGEPWLIAQEGAATAYPLIVSPPPSPSTSPLRVPVIKNSPPLDHLQISARRQGREARIDGRRGEKKKGRCSGRNKCLTLETQVHNIGIKAIKVPVAARHGVN